MLRKGVLVLNGLACNVILASACDSMLSCRTLVMRPSLRNRVRSGELIACFPLGA